MYVLLNTIFAVTYALFNKEGQLSQAPMGKCGADSVLTTQLCVWNVPFTLKAMDLLGTALIGWCCISAFMKCISKIVLVFQSLQMESTLQQCMYLHMILRRVGMLQTTFGITGKNGNGNMETETWKVLHMLTSARMYSRSYLWCCLSSDLLWGLSSCFCPQKGVYTFFGGLYRLS